jgi:hypothetical protein
MFRTEILIHQKELLLPPSSSNFTTLPLTRLAYPIVWGEVVEIAALVHADIALHVFTLLRHMGFCH